MISRRYGWQHGRWTHAATPMADPYPPDGHMAPDARDCDNISSHEEVIMLAMWVTARIKPELRQRFLQAIEVDALGSERDEAGCLRFNVLQDGQDENVYYFYEVYRDQAALEAHRAMPHYGSGATPWTRWTDRPRRSAARPCSRRSARTGASRSHRAPRRRSADVHHHPRGATARAHGRDGATRALAR